MGFGDYTVCVGVDIDIEDIDTVFESNFMGEMEYGIVLKNSFKVL